MSPAAATVAPESCAICATPLPAHAAGARVVCGSVLCAWRLDALLKHLRCAVCTRPLRTDQLASRVCDRTACRDEWLVRRPLAAAHRATQALLASLHARRARAAATAGIAPAEHDGWPITIIPRHVDRAARLAAGRRAALAAHLHAILAEARARHAAGERAADDTADTDAAAPGTAPAEGRARAEAALLATACAVCRGRCCRDGADHAHLRADAMLRVIERHADDDDGAIVARYLGHVAARTMAQSCIYLTSRGCSLPRTLRSDTCNRFFCEGLATLRTQLAGGAPARAFLVQIDGRRVVRSRFVPAPPATSCAVVQPVGAA